MKLKSNVKVENGCLRLEDACRTIDDVDNYLIEAISKEDIAILDVVTMIREHEELDEVNAALRLAQFIVDYGDFTEEMDEE